MSFASRWSSSRRDNNDEALTEAAKKLGAVFIKQPPLDYWVWWAGLSTHWTPMDIKDPKKEGWADEFTKAQRDFMDDCAILGARFEIWRTVEDVLESRRYWLTKR